MTPLATRAEGCACCATSPCCRLVGTRWGALLEAQGEYGWEQGKSEHRGRTEPLAGGQSRAHTPGPQTGTARNELVPSSAQLRRRWHPWCVASIAPAGHSKHHFCCPACCLLGCPLSCAAANMVKKILSNTRS